MNYRFTIYNQDATYDYPSIDDVDDAIDYLKNPDSFRSFDIGLIELLKKKGYTGDINDIKDLSEYLVSRLKNINSQIEKETVISWLNGTHRPKIEPGSRNKIYEICFALNLSLDETSWFFRHVYYDRAFNCHTIEEAVYYYSFLHNVTYAEAQKIIQEVKNIPSATDSDASANYTQYVKNLIHECQSVAELKEFLTQNKGNFNAWNKSALNALNNYVSALIGSPESKSIIDNLKRTIAQKRNNGKELPSLNLADYQTFGLLIQELIFDSKNPYECTAESPTEYVFEAIDNRNIRKNTFILERILGTQKICRNNEKISIPYIVRNNFPSKKTMSDILSKDKILVSKSYDSIRKMIVLLDFYQFWVKVKLTTNNMEFPSDALPKIYLDEANALLDQCGYEKLDAVNPYDWIFLCSARSKNPLEYFRAMINELSDDD
ncbi:MAG: hypothetical protein K2G55_09475 [Lachnospiraceae bacterium]|nr:hypothetical protein [Lachnospiraceae bacterium]MDE7204088.1 hypothetical protein [Lachnospiraceae bacterium]